MVVASETGISGRILNEQLGDAKDLRYFLQTCAGSGFHNSSFGFDGVCNETQRQEKFYAQHVKPVVQNFIEGENGTVLLFGPSQSGKTYTL